MLTQQSARSRTQWKGDTPDKLVFMTFEEHIPTHFLYKHTAYESQCRVGDGLFVEL